jgi:apolipoprotein N-acyltransferase
VAGTALTAVILLILAILALLVAAVVSWMGTDDNPPAGWRKLNFLALGLALWVAVELLRTLKELGL